jgi:hypothetical protein
MLAPAGAMSAFSATLPVVEWPFALFLGVIFALPFGYLALATRKWGPWVFTALLTACIWGAFVFMTASGEPGVNFGIGFLMLAVPVLITALAAGAVHMTGEQSPQ